ncbi:hypothetical protein Acr_12g0000440 [Actinidia rufa]|uniref:HXXXD-type acyl-transferase family protein n=1 Tax=Actinidia rufa TaxID=165716 RepID=A0A7J0FFX0_9ERIC|nr:hypothetical protein Acr_12g0000440 [Actinidia rufa]
MEVKIISEETIRPSSPTPSHLKTFKISLIDQLYPSSYVPVLLFYSPSDGTRNTGRVLTCLKDSLSETLSCFYPLAGRIKDRVSIDCNDEGITFLVSQVMNCHLFELLNNPQIDLLDQFAPCQLYSVGETSNVIGQLAVQANIFSCGGIVIGLCISHKIFDGVMINAFLKCWTMIARTQNSQSLKSLVPQSQCTLNCTILNYTNLETGSCSFEKEILQSNLNAASIFPSREQLPHDMAVIKLSWLIKKGKGISRRFVFDAASISSLKAKAVSQLVPNPSSVLVVVGFLWKCIIKVSQNSSTMVMAVNLRPRMVPLVSENTIGNIIWQTMVHHKGRQDQTELRYIVSLLKEGIAKINSSFVESLIGDEGISTIRKYMKEMDKIHSKENPDLYLCSSWKGLGFKEVDFGWGKPVWVSPVVGVRQPIFSNQVILTETSLGDGIEARVVLGEHEMGMLENDPEFRRFVSLNPPIPMSLAKL